MADNSNQPSAPSNFEGSPNAYDPMMDYLVQNRYGMPMAAPQGAQGSDLSQQFSEQMRAPNAMLAAMTGRAMSAPEELSRLLPGRAGAALSNTGLAMSMIPTGRTIGENIQGVSNAMTELPYARLMHAYQMLQPQLGGMQAQAGIQELLGRGEYYSGRNLSQIESMRQRDAEAAGIRAGMGKPTVQVMPGPGGKPWMGNYETVGIDHDASGQIVPKMKFTPVMPYADYIKGGGVSGTGAVSTTQRAGATSNQQFQFLHDAYAASHPGASEWETGQAVEKLLKASPALATFFGELPEKRSDEAFKTQNSAAKTIHENALKQVPLPKTPEDAQIDSASEYAQYIANLPKGQKAMNPVDYADKVYTQRIRDRRNQLDQVYSGYTSMKPGVERPDYDTYLQQHLQQQQAPQGPTNPY